MFFSMRVVKRRTTFKRSNPGQSGQSTNRNFFQGQLKVIKTIQYRGGTSIKTDLSYGDRRDGSRDAVNRKRRYPGKEETSFKKPRWQ